LARKAMTTKTATITHTTTDNVVGQRTNTMHDTILPMSLIPTMATTSLLWSIG
jgi:hypothetical protein